MFSILWRNIKWRFKNPLSILITILQPLLWLVLYSAVAGQTMQGSGIENYTTFILPGIIVLVTFSACGSGGIINFTMKKSGSFYRVIIAPVSRVSIVLGQMLEAILTSFVEVAILGFVALFFSVKIASGLLGAILIIALVFLTAFFMSGIAYTISLLLPNEAIYETMMNAIVLPIFFLSSALFPIGNLTGGLRIAVMLNPFTHIINAVRSLFFEQSIMWSDMFYVIALFTVMCAASYCLAMWMLKKETAQ